MKLLSYLPTAPFSIQESSVGGLSYKKRHACGLSSATQRFLCQ